MGSIANIAKMMPGIGKQINTNQIRDVEIRLKKNKAMICSMTKKERANPDLFVTDKTARSRIERITRGSGNTIESGQQFISEFQRMRTMMSRMQKQMGMGGNMMMENGGGGVDPNQLSPEMIGAGASGAGNRASRRSAKKGSQGRGFGGGFS